MVEPRISIDELMAAYSDAAGTVDPAGIAAVIHHLTYHLLDLRHCYNAEIFRPRMVEALIQLNAQASAISHEPMPIGNRTDLAITGLEA